MLSLMTFQTTNTSTPARWIAGFVMVAGLGTAIVTGGAVQPPTSTPGFGLRHVAGLGTAIVTGGAVASADPGTTTVGPTAEGSTPGTSDGDSQSKRRRATFSGGIVTEVKLNDVDANNNKNPYAK